MGSLIYSAITSLDGYIADENGKFQWGEPDEEVHEFVNELQRSIGTHLYGRRLYEVLATWETLDTRDQPAYIQEFAEIWQAANKIVYSRTLASPLTSRTRIVREFDPEDSLRFFALRLHEVGFIENSPNEILAEGTDWRFLNELKRELKA